MELISERQINGACYGLKSLNDKLVVTINNSVKVFEMTKNNDLQSESPHSGNIVAIHLDVSKNGFILVGDLMRSISGEFIFDLNFIVYRTSFLTRLGEHVIWSDLRGGIDTFSSFKFVIVFFGESERRNTKLNIPFESQKILSRVNFLAQFIVFQQLD